MKIKMKDKYLVLWFPQGAVVHDKIVKEYNDILKVAKVYCEAYIEAVKEIEDRRNSDSLWQGDISSTSGQSSDDLIWNYFKSSVSSDSVFLNPESAFKFVGGGAVDTGIIFFYMRNNNVRMNICDILYSQEIDDIPKDIDVLSTKDIDFESVSIEDIDIAMGIFDKYKGSKFVYILKKGIDEELAILKDSRVIPGHKSPSEIELEKLKSTTDTIELHRTIWCK